MEKKMKLSLVSSDMESYSKKTSSRSLVETDVSDIRWSALSGAESLIYDASGISDIKRIKELTGMYPTEGVTYCFSTVSLGNDYPCKIRSFDIDNHSILHYRVQFIEGEDFEVSMPVSSLPEEDLKELYVGNTIYASIRFEASCNNILHQ